ncbi:sugar-binding protein [Paenibacillus filicis]|uniref:Sugar-binding protein n=1 Tax=Paenibacillus filicis TaxID=669464 RepID=A0ABU9DHT8_9BACL
MAVRWFGRMTRQRIGLLLTVCLLGAMMPVPGARMAAALQTGNPLFQENFESTVNRWDGSGWTRQLEPGTGSQVGVLSSTGGQYPTVRARSSAWDRYESTNADYTYTFRARTAEAASGTPKLFRTLFRYDLSSGSMPNYYYFEVRPASKAVYFGKYDTGADVRLGGPYSIADKLSGFSDQTWYAYKVEVAGDRFRLSIEGVTIAEGSDASFGRGTIGFAVKNTAVRVDDVQVMPPPEPSGPLIVHTPPAKVRSGEPLSVAASIYDSSSIPSTVYGSDTVTAHVYYRYGADGTEQSLAMTPLGEHRYNAVIPGASTGPIRYWLSAVGSGGIPAISPASGAYEVPVEPARLTITHTPIATLPYNTEGIGTFTVTGQSAGATVTAAVYYRYGEEAATGSVEAVRAGEGFAFTIPATNQYASVHYDVEVRGTDGAVGRSPETGEHTYAVRPFVRYFTDFQQDAVGSMPLNWALRGNQTNVGVVEEENGNKVLKFANTKDGDSASAKFVHSLYRNIDNFKVKFRAKYVNRNPNPSTLYNLWRLRYRASEGQLYNTMEWSTHNTKYIMFRRTPQGGYTNGSFYRSAPDEWHTYEIEASGIHHRLLIDGEQVMEFDDVAGDAPQKGFLQLDTVNGLELLIDDLEITPLPLPYTYYVQPASDYAGIFGPGETPGMDVTLGAGPARQVFHINYTVSRADGDRSQVTSGSRAFTLEAHASLSDTIRFGSGPLPVGTYDIRAELKLNGVPVPEKTRDIRVAVVARIAQPGLLDLDQASKFGFNTGYDLTWHADQLDSVRKMGVRHARQEFDWAAIERSRGVYDFAAYDAVVEQMRQRGIAVTPIMGIATNGIYDGSSVVDTPEGLEALGTFTRALVNHYKGSIRRWEMPNEPELAFRPYIPQELIQVQKTFYTNMKKADLDAVLLAGDHTSGVLGVLPAELELGSYAYADAFSYHRYTYGVMPDGFIQQQTSGVQALVNELGGWKDLYVTESGWPTALSGYPNVSQEAQRDYAVRGFLIDMISDRTGGLYHFTWKNAGFDDNFYNTSFGVTDGNGRPKLAYASLNTLMTTLDQAQYAGKLDVGDATVEAHVFLNRGEPVVVLWKKVNYGEQPVESAPVSTVTLAAYGAAPQLTKIDVKGQGSTLEAVSGVYTLQAGGSPVYLKGFGPQILYQASERLLTAKLQDIQSKLQAAAGETGASDAAAAIAEAGRIHDVAVQALQSVDPTARAAGLEQAIREVYALMGASADLAGDGSMDRIRTYVALEAMYAYAERAGVALAAAQRQLGIGSVTLDYSVTVGSEGTTDSGTARYAYDRRIGDHGLMPVSTSAMMRANRYGRLAEQARTAGDYAIAYAYNMLAREFAVAVRHIVASEPVLPGEVTMSAESVYGDIEAGGSKSAGITLTNRTAVSKTAALKLTVPAGWESAQTEAGEVTIPIAGGGSRLHTFTVHAPADAVRGIYYATVVLMLDGKQADQVKIRLQVIDAIGARLMPVTVPAPELKEITVRLTGTSSSARSGRVVLKGPDGTVLAPSTPGGELFRVEPGQTVDLKFRWTDPTDRPYREYLCSLSVIDTTDGRLIFNDDETPLDFLLIQKASSALVIDGDLSDWSDAFPIHLRGAERNATGVYDKEDLDATVYLKWDEQNLYLAARVTDDIHKASEPPSGIWKNDSIQVAIDPLNDKGGTYRSDDIDFGLALNDFRELLGYVFAASPPNRTGDISTAIPFQIKRDDVTRQTVYEVQIPGNSIVQDLESRLFLGSKIGFNIVVGDADFQEGRQNYVGWTKGIADSKNPGLYDSFIMTDAPFTGPGPNTGPPQSRVSVQGDQTGDWYTSDVKVYLAIADPGSEGTAIRYSLDQGSTWSLYRGPISFTAEGTHHVAYFAENAAGQREASKTLTIPLDRSGPQIGELPRTAFRQTEAIELMVTVEDMLSGVSSVELRLDGHPIAGLPASFPAGTMAPGYHTLDIRAADRAGHDMRRTYRLEIGVSAAELGDVIVQGRADGRIRSQALASSLLAKARLAGWLPPDSWLRAFTLLGLSLEIQAHAGGDLSKSFAELLLQDISYIRNNPSA